MNKEEFIMETSGLEVENYNRASKIVQDVLNHPYRGVVIDAHCHVFDGKCVDAMYVILRMLGNVPRRVLNGILRKLSRNKIEFEFDKIEDLIYGSEEEMEKLYQDFFMEFSDDSYLEEMYERLDGDFKLDNPEESIEMNLFQGRFKEIIKILGKRNMAGVYNGFEKKFSIKKSASLNEGLITVVLGMDLNRGWGRHDDVNYKIKKSQTQQNEELLALSQKEPVLPFFPIDPRRVEHDKEEEDLYSNFLKAFKNTERSFYGVKVYPALGYHPNDPGLDPIFQFCSEKNIPVLSHCGGNMVSTFEKKLYVNDGGNVIKVPGLDRTAKAFWLNDPKRWEAVLEKYPNLRLNLGHFGGVKEWKNKGYRDADATRIKDIIGLIEKYDNVYADFSYNLIRSQAIDNFKKEFNKSITENTKLHERVLFGTDYWVVLPAGNIGKQQREFIDTIGKENLDKLTQNSLNYLNFKR